MKKIISILACFCILFVAGITLTACGKAKLTEIDVDTRNAHTAFVTGERFTTEGLRVKDIYSDTTEKELAQDEFTVEAVMGQTKVALNNKFEKAGTYTVTICYEYEKTTFKDSYNIVVTPLEEDNGVGIVNNEEDLKTALENYSAVKLNDNVVLSDTISISKEFAIDLNGHTISNTEDIWKNTESEKKWSLISVKEDGNLVIKGEGNLNAKENDCYALDVNGGELTIDGGNYKGNICAVYVFSGKLTVNGGEFDIQQLSDHSDKRFLLNCFDENYQNGSAKVIVKGGSFHGFNPANDKSESLNGKIDFVPDGFYAEENEGVYTIKAYNDESVHVKSEAAFREAMTARKTQMVVLENDITFTKFIQLEGADCQITLDLNGHNLNADGSNVGFWIVSSAKMTVKNSKSTGRYTSNGQTASFNVGAQYFLEASRAGSLTIESGDFVSTAEVVLVNNGKAEIKGGKFNSTGSRHWALNIYDQAKDKDEINIEVSGGEFTNFNPASPNTNDKSTYLKSGFKSQLKGGNGNVYEVVAQ